MTQPDHADPFGNLFTGPERLPCPAAMRSVAAQFAALLHRRGGEDDQPLPATSPSGPPSLSGGAVADGI